MRVLQATGGEVVTIEDLIEYGFREWKDSFGKQDRSFQFTYRANGRKAFFVNVRFWRFTKYDAGAPDGWDAHAQFNAGGKTFNVDLFVKATDTPAEVVEWFFAMWVQMRCDYYQKEEQQ